ncbi:recombinase family protein [Parendozoicomonas haliclonae]|nr:recombinase family protein [Parendozoicomonas haliclonae]
MLINKSRAVVSMKAISYHRISTAAQIKGTGTARQHDSIRAYLNNHPELELVNTLEDIGRSGYHNRNVEEGELGLLLRSVEAGEINTPIALLVASGDRLTRQSPRKALGLLDRLIEAGVVLHDVMTGRVYDVTAEATDLIMFIIAADSAYKESQVKADRSRAAWEKRRESMGKLPAFLTRVDGQIVPKTDASALLAEIFALASKGVGTSSIASQMNKENPVSFTGGRWSGSTLNKILRDERVVTYGLVTSGVFQQVQLGMEERKKSCSSSQNRRVSPLSGITFCASCGGKMHLQRVKEHLYLSCGNARVGQCGQTKRAPLRYAEDHIKSRLLEYCKVALPTIQQGKGEAHLACEQAIKTEESVIANIVDAIAKSPASAALLSALGRAEAELERLKGDLLKMEAAVKVTSTTINTDEGLTVAVSDLGTTVTVKRLKSGGWRLDADFEAIDTGERWSLDKKGNVVFG